MNNSNCRVRKCIIYTIGWLAYGSTYLLRKPLGVIKTDLEDELDYSKAQLGWLDFSLLLPYAVSQIFFSKLGDQYGPRQTFACCLLVAALSMITYGLWSNFWILFTLMMINGSVQGLCWPSCTMVLSSWVTADNKNSIFGFYGCSGFALGILGTAMSVYLQSTYGWRTVYILPSVICLLLSVIVYFFYTKNSPSFAVSGGTLKAADSEILPSIIIKKKDTSLFRLWKLPLVVELSSSIFCLKLVRYTMYMWLPIFLSEHMNYSKSDSGMYSSLFDLGGAIGSVFSGILIDRCCKDKSLMSTAIFELMNVVTFLFFMFMGEINPILCCICIFFGGAFNCAADTMISGSIASQIVQSSTDGASVIGLINGFGSLGSVLEGPIVSVIVSYFGWNGLYHMMIIVSVLGFIAMCRATFKAQGSYK